MKARKAMKRLQRVETLLGTVIDQYVAVTEEVTTMLDAARASVVSANKAIEASPAKTAAKTEPSAKRKLSNATRKRLSAAAKKRWAEAKRSGTGTLAKPVRKTLTASAS